MSIYKTFLLTDDFLVLMHHSQKKVFYYYKFPFVRKFVRKLVNSAVSDIPNSFFKFQDSNLSIGKKITLLESIELSPFEIIFKSRFNETYSFVLESNSVVRQLFYYILERIPADGFESFKPDIYSGWGRPAFIPGSDPELVDCEFSLKEETAGVKGVLYSVSLLKNGASYIVKTLSGFKGGAMDKPDIDKFSAVFIAFLEEFNKNFSEPQYSRLRFIANKCQRCGECCKIYEVEANPFEIERISDFLHISMEKFRELFLHENLFSWNEFSFMLNKEKGFGTPCVFQGKCRDGLYGCKIYSVRPEVCRKFLPSLGKCILNGELPDILEVSRNLVSFTLTEDSCSFHTDMTYFNGILPVVLDVDKENSAFRSLLDFFYYFKDKISA